MNAEARCILAWERTDTTSQARGAKGIYLVRAVGGAWEAQVGLRGLGVFASREAAERQCERHEAEEAPRRPVQSMPPGAAEDAGSYATIPRDPAEVDRGRALGVARSPRAVYDMISPTIAKESQEVFLVLPVDLRGQPLSRPVEIARGQRDRVHVDPSDVFRPLVDSNGKVFRPVVASNAKGFILIHIHPSGHATPSPADRDLTARLEKGTLELWGDGEGSEPSVKFLDHVILARSARRGEYFSFRDGKVREVRH